MSDCVQIQVVKVPFKMNDGSVGYRLEIGNLTGKISFSNVSLELVMSEIQDAIKELEE